MTLLHFGIYSGLRLQLHSEQGLLDKVIIQGKEENTFDGKSTSFTTGKGINTNKFSFIQQYKPSFHFFGSVSKDQTISFSSVCNVRLSPEKQSNSTNCICLLFSFSLPNFTFSGDASDVDTKKVFEFTLDQHDLQRRFLLGHVEHPLL